MSELDKRFSLMRPAMKLGDLMTSDELLERLDGRFSSVFRMNDRSPEGLKPPEVFIRANNKRGFYLRSGAMDYIARLEAYELAIGRRIGG